MIGKDTSNNAKWGGDGQKKRKKGEIELKKNSSQNSENGQKSVNLNKEDKEHLKFLGELYTLSGDPTKIKRKKSFELKGGRRRQWRRRRKESIKKEEYMTKQASGFGKDFFRFSSPRDNRKTSRGHRRSSGWKGGHNGGLKSDRSDKGGKTREDAKGKKRGNYDEFTLNRLFYEKNHGFENREKNLAEELECNYFYPTYHRDLRDGSIKLSTFQQNPNRGDNPIGQQRSKRLSRWERTKRLREQSEGTRQRNSVYLKMMLKELESESSRGDTRRQTRPKPRGYLGKRSSPSKNIQPGSKDFNALGIPRIEARAENLIKYAKRGQFGNFHSTQVNQAELEFNEVEAMDQRLRRIPDNYFKNKRILDLGCGDGSVIFEIFEHFSPKKLKGIDLDHRLIYKAVKRLRTIDENFENSSPEDPPEVDDDDFYLLGDMPACFTSKLDKEILKQKSKKFNFNEKSAARFSKSGPEGEKPASQAKKPAEVISFEVDNFLKKEDTKTRHDVVLCLSVVKWVHLNWGDKGVVKLFEKVKNELRLNGVLIIDFSSWSKYKKKKGDNVIFEFNYNCLETKPGTLPAVLLNFGFELERKVDGEYQGEFKKPIYIFRRVR